METNHASPVPRVGEKTSGICSTYEKGNPKLLKRNTQNTFKTHNQMEEIY